MPHRLVRQRAGLGEPTVAADARDAVGRDPRAVGEREPHETLARHHPGLLVDVHRIEHARELHAIAELYARLAHRDSVAVRDEQIAPRSEAPNDSPLAAGH